MKKSWADQYFFESLSEFINRLHEDRGGQLELLAVFNPLERDELIPQRPPIYLLVLYNTEVDFLKERLFLKEHDPSGLFEFFCYSVEAFRNMLRDNNPIALIARESGLVLFEKGDISERL
ncbi:MAG: hypothetical protein D6710_10305 [Nitrospirae bacterium]|nr:MAG: hypothetical protein D6710_10305 [Nitrospirota bacterium]